MDHDRRLELAAIAQAQLPDLHQAVIESWRDLLPQAASWPPPHRSRAHAAAEAALTGLVDVIAQGDLDEASWRRTREVVHGRGHATPDEVAEVLRTVRIVGFELLLEHLAAVAGLTADERWGLHLQAHAYAEQLHRTRDEVDAATVEALLGELEASGPDLA
jgi:hypothetical protein